MSDDQKEIELEEEPVRNSINSKTGDDEEVEEVKSESAIVPKSVSQDVVDVEDDLEDGEIDDDDDDGNDEPIVMDSKIVAASPPILPIAAPSVANKVMQPLALPSGKILDDLGKKSSKSSKHDVVEDDFAGSIESAIAAALKKDGIMPPMPKILESREENDRKVVDKELALSKSSRRRKRRKLRDDREKDKEKKKSRGSPDTTKAGVSAAAATMEEELDDDEMLCVRGGSPPPSGTLPILPLPPPIDTNSSSKKDPYESDDSYTSYESYDSGPSYQRYTSRKKDSNSGGGTSNSRSKRKERNRRDDERRSEKRSRRNYDDSGGEDKYQDRHPQQPRKLELCKFYLMECCAKKDKCSYMHSDFPCKYYYLGMECVYRAACKFSHGKPLSDQLRNVLLKHLETAPKEILGTFRRISRENALSLMMATHDKICQEHGVENTMAPATNTTQTVTQAGVSNKQHQSQSLQQRQLQQQQQSEVIPSLLDMMLVKSNDPKASSSTLTSTSTSANLKSESKQRKSRWCDSSIPNPSVAPSKIAKQSSNLEPPSSSAPSYLDLKNLTGILSTDRIEKLSQFGVVNLEQINQLTLSQLNKIGLTINEISEIQLNARNMARLGLGMPSDAATNQPSNSLPSSQDVDMRFLPSCLALTTTTVTTSETSGSSSVDALQSKTVLSSSPLSAVKSGGTTPADGQLETSNVTGIDYSQYLRDSNLGYDKNDMLDDEKDEEQLVIDDQDLDGFDESSEVKNDSDSESKALYGYPVANNSESDERLPPTIHISEKLQNILKDPTNLHTVNMSDLMKPKEISADLPSEKIHVDQGEENFYGSNTIRQRESREDSRDPRQRDDPSGDPRHHHHHHQQQPPEPKDEYRDPRLGGSSSGRSMIENKGFTSSLGGYKTSTLRSDDDSDRDRSRSRSRSQSPSRSRSRSRSNSRSRSQTPQHNEPFQPLYERPTMYDWTPKCLQEDRDYSRRNTKSDKDMRLSGFLDSQNSDIDLRLPFQPIKNITIAKEIDGSMSTISPITYKVYELDIPDPKYCDLRQSFQSEDTADPRLRRILGLPELSNSKALAALTRPNRPTIASPSSVESCSSPTRSEKERHSAIRGPRIDPRRAAATTTTASYQQQQVPQQLPPTTGNPQQNIEIRLLLQKSNWYKNLNSKAKIMVNQQLALVSTELKRYHQDPSANKVFDIQFIVNNQSLQEILTCLGIYIDDNGQVAHVESDNDNMMMGGMGMGGAGAPGVMDYGNVPMMMMNDPSMQQRMGIQNQMEFLRGPPPNMNNMMGGPLGPGGGPGMYGNPGNMMPPYGRNPRMGIGMPPGSGGVTGTGGVGFNPFAGSPSENSSVMMEPNFCGGPHNPFSNNFVPNGGGNNFGNQQMNRGNRNPNRNQSGNMIHNGNSRNSQNQNRRMFNKQNRRGMGGSNPGGNMHMGKSSPGATSDTHVPPSTAVNANAAANTNQNINQAADVEEESWDD